MAQAAIEAPFTAEHQLFRQNLRNYIERELAPHALEWDEAGIFPRRKAPNETAGL